MFSKTYCPYCHKAKAALNTVLAPNQYTVFEVRGCMLWATWSSPHSMQLYQVDTLCIAGSTSVLLVPACATLPACRCAHRPAPCCVLATSQSVLTGLFAIFVLLAPFLQLDKMEDGDAIQSALADITGGRTVPRVFIGGRFIGEAGHRHFGGA